MTHDELRDYIDKFDAAGMVNEPVVKALRAVVELHKPYESTDAGLLCRYCVDEGSKTPWYPCRTIQDIEKELK